MADTRPTLLIPVLFPDPPLYPIEEEHIQGMNGFKITLFGYWEVPGGISEESARQAHETEAEAVLYEMASQFSHAGAETDVSLTFGPSEQSTRELQRRIIAGTESDAVLSATQLTWWQNVLIPLRDSRNQEKIVDFVTAFDTEDVFALELYHVTPDESAVEAGRDLLESAAETLLDRGFSEPDIEITVEVRADAPQAIAERAQNHNVVIVGETKQLDEDLLYGPVCECVTASTETPMVVVRN